MRMDGGPDRLSDPRSPGSLRPSAPNGLQRSLKCSLHFRAMIAFHCACWWRDRPRASLHLLHARNMRATFRDVIERWNAELKGLLPQAIISGYVHEAGQAGHTSAKIAMF